MMELDKRQYTKQPKKKEDPITDLSDSYKKALAADRIISIDPNNYLIQKENERMEILSKWEAIAVVAVALAMGAYFIADSYFSNQVKIEAVKSGLVQDKAGNWIKP